MYADYHKVVDDKAFLDQLCSYLVRRLKLTSDSINELCSLLPQSDQFDFYDFRKGKITIEELKLRVLNIDRNFIRTR